MPHWLRRGTMNGMTEEHLRSIMAALDAKLIKRDSEKAVSKRTLVWSLILKEFPSATLEEQGDMWIRLVGETASKDEDLAQDALLMKKCLSTLPQEEQEYDFKPLKERLGRMDMEKRWTEYQSRQVDERKQKEHETPSCLKDLCPRHTGVRLVFDQGQMAFEAYYPAGKPQRSVAAAWAGARTAHRTPLTCLMYCVDFMWNNHIEKGRAAWLKNVF